jgi:hypothetical protein
MEVIIADSSSSVLTIPISFIFWSYIAAFIIHVMDESLMGETFVGMVKRQFIPEFEWKHFIGGNTFFLLISVISIVLYEIFGGFWITAPLIMVFVFTSNEIWHLVATIVTRKYSPGLASGVLYWILFYFLVRYSFIPNTVPVKIILVAAITGTLITVFMISSFFIFKKRFKRLYGSG